MRLVFYVFHPPPAPLRRGTKKEGFHISWMPASTVHPEPVEGLAGVARLAGRGWMFFTLEAAARNCFLSPAGDCVVITFLSFRASEARHGIQYYQHVLDAGFHRHDDVDGFFTIATQSPGRGEKTL